MCYVRTKGNGTDNDLHHDNIFMGLGRKSSLTDTILGHLLIRSIMFLKKVMMGFMCCICLSSKN